MFTLLIADDHPLFLDGLALLLAAMLPDACILQAQDMTLVRQHLSTQPVDLLLLDRVMPGMDGMDRLTELAETWPQLPVAIISASDSSQHIREALDAGAAGFIPKTTSPADMVIAVKRLLAGKTYIPQQAWQSIRKVYVNGEISLSARQHEILTLLGEGSGNKQIADRLQLAEGTIKQHLNNIFRALGVTNRTQALQRARDLGFVS